MTDQLKPCPFCGGMHLELYKGHHNSYVACHRCGAYGPDMPKEDWNTRANLATPLDDPRVKALVEAVRHEREMVCQDFDMQSAAARAVDAALSALEENK